MLRLQLTLFISWLLLFAFIDHAIAQTDSSTVQQNLFKEKPLFSIGAGLQHGFIFAHSQNVQNTKGANPTGVELYFSWQKNDAAAWALCHCYPRKGLVLTYYDYDTRILGKSYSAAYFLEPVYRLRRNLFFSFKGSSGFSYLTNPFDSITNPANQSYSTHLSTYLVVGLGLWYRLNDNWWLQTSVNYQHESNGGLRQPNKGINWPTAGLLLSYQKTARPFYTGPRTIKKFWRDYSLRWDAGVFGLPRRTLDERGNSRRLPLVGVSVQAAKQVGRISALNIGMETYRDQELRVRLNRDSIKASAVKSGILAGHEFLLGRFGFSQRIGIYVFDQTPYYDNWYHRWGIQYRASKRIGFALNLQVHKHIADFADLRITYTFQDFTNYR